jgi:hypothetical protein
MSKPGTPDPTEDSGRRTNLTRYELNWSITSEAKRGESAGWQG